MFSVAYIQNPKSKDAAGFDAAVEPEQLSAGSLQQLLDTVQQELEAGILCPYGLPNRLGRGCTLDCLF